MDKPAGSLRLLSKKDLETPVVGWKSTVAGEGGLINPKGWAMLRVVVQKILDGRAVDLYDQPIFVENPGAIVVCRADRKVGLVQNFRFVGKRILEAGGDYVRRLDKEHRWEELLETLGAWKWELPRGLANFLGSPKLEQFVLAAANAEALEEAGYLLADAKIIGTINVNPTFFVHSQYVVQGKIVAKREARPEPSEIIGKIRLFSAREIRRMVKNNELDDGLTLAALAIAGFHF